MTLPANVSRVIRFGTKVMRRSGAEKPVIVNCSTCVFMLYVTSRKSPGFFLKSQIAPPMESLSSRSLKAFQAARPPCDSIANWSRSFILSPQTGSIDTGSGWSRLLVPQAARGAGDKLGHLGGMRQHWNVARGEADGFGLHLRSHRALKIRIDHTVI